MTEILFHISPAPQKDTVSGVIDCSVAGDHPALYNSLNSNRPTFAVKQSVCAEFQGDNGETSIFPAKIRKKEKFKHAEGAKKTCVTQSEGRFYVVKKNERKEVKQADCEALYEVKYLDTGIVVDCDVSFLHGPLSWHLDTEHFDKADCTDAKITEAMLKGVVKFLIGWENGWNNCFYSQYYNTNKDQFFPDARDAANKNEQGYILITGTRGDAVFDDCVCVGINCGDKQFLFDRVKLSWSRNEVATHQVGTRKIQKHARSEDSNDERPQMKKKAKKSAAGGKKRSREEGRVGIHKPNLFAFVTSCNLMLIIFLLTFLLAKTSPEITSQAVAFSQQARTNQMVTDIHDNIDTLMKNVGELISRFEKLSEQVQNLNN